MQNMSNKSKLSLIFNKALKKGTFFSKAQKAVQKLRSTALTIENIPRTSASS